MKLRSDLNAPEVREALEEWIPSADEDFGIDQKLLKAIQEPKPMQPPIPWKYIDKRYRWMAMGHNGSWFVYEENPHEPDNRWMLYGYQELPCARGADRPWRETLIERPEDE